MREPILEDNPDSEDINLYYKNRLWKRSRDIYELSGHYTWMEVHELNGMELRDRVEGERRAILERFYEDHKNQAVKRIPRFPRLADSKPEAQPFRAPESTTNDGSSVATFKRTKHGVTVRSNDGIHSFGIGVWKSTKYRGRTTICLFVAGRRFIYTVDKAHMASLRSEVARGEPT